jgi:hypothetical protein
MHFADASLRKGVLRAHAYAAWPAVYPHHYARGISYMDCAPTATRFIFSLYQMFVFFMNTFV